MKVELAENPIRAIRKREGLTIKQFADRCNVHYQALYLTECGVHPMPLPGILSECLDLGYELQWICDTYLTFVRDTRLTFQSRFEPYSLPTPDMTYSPVGNWRQSLGLTKMGFCKSLCVQPALQSRLESGKAQKIYSQLEVALYDVNFPEDLLAELKDRIEEYHFHIRR